MDVPSRHPTARRWLAAALWTAALLPFGGAVLAHNLGPTPQQPEPREEPPALVFDQYLVNLGNVPSVPVVRGRFRFTNGGEEPVRITELEPSCGCLNPRLAKRVYEPGETGQFFVRVKTAGEDPGLQEYTVRIAYEDPRPQETVVSFKVVLPEERVTVRPRALIFYQLGSARKTTREVVVTDSRERPLQVIALECPSPLIEAMVTGSDRDEHGRRRIRIAVSVAGRVPPGEQRTVLTLKTDDASHPRLHVPLMIRGRGEGKSPPTARREKPENSARR